MSRTARLTVVLLFVAWTIDFVDRLVINFALPAIADDLDLDHTGTGMIVSAFFLAYAAMQLPGGLLADRFGALRMCVIGMLAWSVFTGLTALAWSFGALLVARFVFGLVQGVFPAAATKALAERSTPAERTTAAGWTNASNACGVLLAAVIAAALLPTIGWRGMFVAISVLGVLVVLAWSRWMPPPLTEASPVGGGSWSLFRVPALIGCAAIYFGYGAFNWGLVSWVPTYLHEARGLELDRAALLAVFPTVAAAVGIVSGGWLSDRLRGRPRRIVVPSMATAAAGLFVLPATSSVPVFMIVLTVATGVGALTYMAALALPLRALPSTLIGTAAGMIVFGAQLGGILAPLLFGVIVDRVSYAAAFGALASGPLVAIVAASLMPQSAAAFLASVRGKPALAAHLEEAAPSVPQDAADR
ncbi:MFS transporter [Nocardia thraciensis]